MKAMAGWMAALMLLAAPAAFCDELPPGVEIQQVEGAEPQQAAPRQEEPEQEAAPQAQQAAPQEAAPQEAVPQEAAPQETTQEQAAPRQAPQTGDDSLLAAAGLAVSAGALALIRKGKKDSGDRNTAQ